MKKLLTGIAVLALTTPAAFAAGLPGGTVPVPEISALQGTAALTALAAIVLMVWERRRAV